MRLPKPGEDEYRWGEILNKFLLVSHTEDGAIRPEALKSAGSPTKLSGLSDVSTDQSPADNQVLAFNAEAASWQPTSIAAVVSTDPSLTGVTSVAGKTGDVTLLESDIANLTSDLATTERTGNKGQPSGYASLDTHGKVPMTQLQPFPMPKQSVAVCMTTMVNISSPGATLDGQSLPSGSRVLLVSQSPGYQNGIYTYNGATTPMIRTPDANTGPLIQNAFVFVNLGTQAQAGWENVTTGPIGINATPLTWKQFEAPLLSQPTGQLNDNNGNPVLVANATNTPVNQVTLSNAASGNAPVISSSGSDTNVGLALDTQGTGAITTASAMTITNPNNGPDLLIQNSSGNNDSVLTVQGWGTKAAYIFNNSRNVAYGYIAGQINGSNKWILGRNNSNNGFSIYTLDGTKQAVQFDDNQNTRLFGGLAYHRTAVTGANYTAVSNDCLIAYTGPPQPVTIILPLASTVGNVGNLAQTITVKDEAGGASNGPISINASTSSTIDGMARVVSTNFGSMQFYSDGLNWHVLGS